MLLCNNLVAAARRLLEWKIFQGGCHATISLIGLLNLKFGVISLSSLRRQRLGQNFDFTTLGLLLFLVLILDGFFQDIDSNIFVTERTLLRINLIGA